jgi:hypothetical protein
MRRARRLLTKREANLHANANSSHSHPAELQTATVRTGTPVESDRWSGVSHRSAKLAHHPLNRDRKE